MTILLSQKLPPFFPAALVVLSQQSFSPVSHTLRICATLLSLSGFICTEMVVTQLCVRNEITIHMLKTFYLSLKLFVSVVLMENNSYISLGKDSDCRFVQRDQLSISAHEESAHPWVQHNYFLLHFRLFCG